METFIEALPKVELHLHIEGSLEPELMFELAHRNGVDIPLESTDAVRAAYEFDDLQSFLDIYYQGAQVLIEEQDFFNLCWAYLLRCQQDNVQHTEIFFDPQTHTDRGIAFATVINGLHRACEQGRRELGISSLLILCFLRHLDEAAAFATLQQALPYRDRIVAVGLDSAEAGKLYPRCHRAARRHAYRSRRALRRRPRTGSAISRHQHAADRMPALQH
jgi:adenosine deaminase